MRHPLLAVVALLLLPRPGFSRAPSPRTDDTPVHAAHLFILSGQSNMARLDPAESFHPAVSAAFGADHVIVVKDAQGGQPIRRWDRAWAPSSGHAPSGDGALYDRLMTKVADATRGRSLASVTFIWMQGERDARESHGDVYAESLRRVIARLERDLGRDDLNVVIGRLSDFDLADARYPHWTMVRKAQVDLAETRPRTAWVDTDDLNDGTNDAGDAIADDLHCSVAGSRTLGERFAREAVALVRAGERARARAAGRPDVILVMADDQGWGDVGSNGHPFVRTPNLDAMAAGAMVFDRFHAAAPVCSPTRASVLTGRAPVRTKVTNHGRYMRPHERTIAQAFKNAGYRTGLFGKYHLGSAQPDSPCNPSALGFDEWVVGVNFFDNDPYLSRNGVVEHRRGKGSVLLMDDALAFIEREGGGEHPLFVVIWFPSPHDPHEEVPEDPTLYDGLEHAGYYREITLLDEQLGRLRRELRAAGRADDTILWYCSDNGGLVHETAGGRARKGSVYEGGLRVPSILEWPARGLAGRVDVPVWTCDMFPTLMALAGLEFDAPHPLDGRDVSDIIRGTATAREAPMGFWHGFQGGQVTRSDQILAAIMEKQQAGLPPPHDPARMQKDVFEFPQFEETRTTGHAAWLDWPWKLHRIDGERYELYHLLDDPMESTNLVDDPRHAERTRRMKDELDAWMRSVVRSINGDDYR